VDSGLWRILPATRPVLYKAVSRSASHGPALRRVFHFGIGSYLVLIEQRSAFLARGCYASATARHHSQCENGNGATKAIAPALGVISGRASFLASALCLDHGVSANRMCVGVTAKTRDPQRTGPILRDGETTQFAVQDHYGPPANRYEGGHVITYVMRRDRNGQLYVLSSKQTYTPTPEEDPYPGVYNLVLVFGEDGVLERHALLQVR